jgi:UDP-N-acetylmuramyl tripeptide synthase
VIASYSPETELRGLPPTFRQWQKRCFELGVPPVIAVAGSRGKSTVVRLLQGIFDRAGIQSAIWTDFGVEINGRRQSREIAGWNRALARLMEHSLDVAVQELDWNLVSAVGLPRSTYPIVAITNVCANDPHCLITPAGQIAQRALPRVAMAAHPQGVICINAEDYALERALVTTGARPIVVGKSDAAPLVRQHHATGGISLWTDREHDIAYGYADESFEIANMLDIPLTRAGHASFEETNVLVACAAALATGIGPEIIAETIVRFEPSISDLPGSFSVREVGAVTTVVDRVMPSWFLRPVLRAANPQSRRRQITVIGGMNKLPQADVIEIGRLLGRSHGAVILHGELSEERYADFRRGVARNPYPPVLIHLPTERRAINRAMQAVRAEDVLLFLTDGDPGPAIRAVARMRP